jgi:hypothetical protein
MFTATKYCFISNLCCVSIFGDNGKFMQIDFYGLAWGRHRNVYLWGTLYLKDTNKNCKFIGWWNGQPLILKYVPCIFKYNIFTVLIKVWIETFLKTTPPN